SGFTGIAAPALNPALTEVTKSLAGLVLASEAGHGFSPLAFCGEKPQNQFGSRSWLTPRFGLAPTPVSAEAGALNQQLSNYGGLIAIVGLLSVQPLSADTLRGPYLTPKSFPLRLLEHVRKSLAKGVRNIKAAPTCNSVTAIAV